MKVRHLIELLRTMNPEARVISWNRHGVPIELREEDVHPFVPPVGNPFDPAAEDLVVVERM